MVRSILQYLFVLHSRNLRQLFILTWSTDATWGFVSLTYIPTFHAWVTIVRKKWLSPYYSTYWCYVHQTCTNSSTDATWLFVSLTYISCLSDHGQKEMVKSILQYLLVLHSPNLHQLFILTWSTDSVIPWGHLCPWPTFHAWVTMVRKKWLGPIITVTIGATCTFTKLIQTVHLDMIYWCHMVVCHWPTFHASVTKTQKGNSRTPVMVPITIMSSDSLIL